MTLLKNQPSPEGDAKEISKRHALCFYRVRLNTRKLFPLTIFFAPRMFFAPSAFNPIGKIANPAWQSRFCALCD